MSPVHVIVGEDERAEAMWSAAFTGAVDLYRFPRNVDAFERLTAAEAPIDLVVLTPAQRGPFNLTPDQFVARLLEGPLGHGRYLSNLHVIVVGQPLQRSHPRVMAVSTLDAAIRLVKFGEIEHAPRPQAPAAPVARPATSATPANTDSIDAIAGSGIAGSIISRIWDAPSAPDAVIEPAPKPKPQRDAVVGGGARPDAQLRPTAQAVEHADIARPAANPQLFTRPVAPGFIVNAATAPGAPNAADPAPQQPVMGGGAAPAPIAVPGESIEVATGGLQPARPYQLPNGGGYRGPAVRAGQVNAASHANAVGGQPVPPALASQVHSMVYGGGIGNPNDPLLTWSSGARADATPVPAPAQPHAAPVAVAVPVPQPQANQPVRTVPMEPPAGVYGGAPAPAPTQVADPFLARAEQAGGDVSFG